jgi:hypothetical protein
MQNLLNMKQECFPLDCGVWRCLVVLWISADVSDEVVASIIRVDKLLVAK